MDPATVDQQFEEIVRNSTSSVPIPMRNLTAELAARIVVLTSFTVAVLVFEIHTALVALVAVSLVALATGEAIIDRRVESTATSVSV